MEANKKFKITLGNILTLLGSEKKVVEIVRKWDFNHPREEDLIELQNYLMRSVDDVKSKMVESQNRLLNCTTFTVKVVDNNEVES
jgi:hypothetical protein